MDVRMSLSAWPKAENVLVGVEIDHRGAGAEAAGEIDAELLDHVALHLGDRDLQHHLLMAMDRRCC